jgi:hypothetical protein
VFEVPGNIGGMQTLLCLQDGVLLQPRMSKVGVSSAQGVLLELVNKALAHPTKKVLFLDSFQLTRSELQR